MLGKGNWTISPSINYFINLIISLINSSSFTLSSNLIKVESKPTFSHAFTFAFT